MQLPPLPERWEPTPPNKGGLCSHTSASLNHHHCPPPSQPSSLLLCSPFSESPCLFGEWGVKGRIWIGESPKGMDKVIPKYAPESAGKHVSVSSVSLHPRLPRVPSSSVLVVGAPTCSPAPRVPLARGPRETFKKTKTKGNIQLPILPSAPLSCMSQPPSNL